MDRWTLRRNSSLLTVCIAALMGCGRSSDRHSATPPERAATAFAALSPALVQTSAALPSIVTVPFNGAQTAGDLNIVVVGWYDTTTTVTSVTDSAGNTYALAVGPTGLSPTGSQSIYYAKNIVGSATNAVTANFNVPAPYPDIRVLEYRGLDPNSPLDATAAATGNGTTSSNTITTTHANDLLVAANYVDTHALGPGTGFTSEMITSDGNIVEDEAVSATGTYDATAPLGAPSGANGWIMQTVAFMATSAGSAAFVQGNNATPTTTALSAVSSLTLPLTTAQAAGDLNVVVVGWGDTTTTVTSVTDTAGNVYTLAIGPTTQSGSDPGSQSIYYAKNIVGSAANAVTVTLSASPSWVELRTLEYSGLDPSGPLDVTSASTGNSLTATSGPLTTTQANELLVVANVDASHAVGPSDGYTIEVNTSGDIVEDEAVSSAGSYSASVSLFDWGHPVDWIQQMVAFKVAEPPTGGCAGCQPVQGDNPFETRASILGRVQTFAGAAVTGLTVSVYDAPVGSSARSDVSVTIGSDGSFLARLTQFPNSELPGSPPHHLMVFIDSPGFLRVMREVYAHPGDAVDLGLIDVAPRDPNTKTIDSSGGSVTDSQGLITLVIPAGALSSPTPVTVTAIMHREEMPAPLPDITLTGYGFELEPSGTQLAAAATLHIQNWRALPTNISIPAGSFDPVSGGWKHVGTATWDGSSWTYSVSHFSSHDMNPSNLGEWVVLAMNGADPSGGQHACVGSSVGLNGGDLLQSFALPTYGHRGRDYGVTLNYNSGLAGNRTLGAGPQSQGQAVPTAGVGVSVRGLSMKGMCVPQGSAAALIAGNPGSCGGGTCSLGGLWTGSVESLQGHAPFNVNPTTSQGPSADAIDLPTWVNLPLSGGGTPTGSGFVTQHLQAGVSSPTGAALPGCVSGGGSAAVPTGFGSPLFQGPPQAVNVQQGAVIDVQQRVLVHHRVNSPFGPGWAIEQLPRLFREPGSDHVALVRGDGSVEDFRPRPSFQAIESINGGADIAFASDPSTGENFMATAGTIVRVNADASMTPVLTGLSFSGGPQSMAVTHVGAEQRFVIALVNQLIQVHPGGAIDVLYTRGTATGATYAPSQVAARSDLAIYTEGFGFNPVLYRFRLSSTPGPAESISHVPGGDPGLDPATTSLSGYSFYGPAGVAFAPTGQLYVADAPRNAIFLVGLEAHGEIGPTSPIHRVMGDGAGRFISAPGSAAPAVQFAINRPFDLSTAPDGTLLVGTSYGVAAYRPSAQEAEWLVTDGNSAGGGSDLSFTLLPNLNAATFVEHADSGVHNGNILATGPRSFLISLTGGPFPGTVPSFASVSGLASDLDPTRTVTVDAATGAATLTDTTQALVDDFDAQGRVVERDLRTGEPVMAVTYVDATSDRVSAIADPEGHATTFAYDGSGRLTSITDPAQRVTLLGRDASTGDLTSITEPDGEIITFAYQGHHMTSKTARGSDTTTYTYASDGTLHTATRPAGETTTLTAAMSQAPQHDANFNLQYGSTYTDAHGVQHSVVTDGKGQVVSDSYTADGVAYTDAAAYYGNLEPTAGDFVPRVNRLLRIQKHTTNGVAVGLEDTFDSLGRLVAEGTTGVHGGGTFYSRTYDAKGFLSNAVQDYALNIQRDAMGHPLKIVDAHTGRETDFAWRSDGQPATIVQHGVTYTMSYDDSGTATHNLTGISDTLGRTQTFGYDGSGNVGIASDGVTTHSFAYDSNNRLLVSADAQGNQTTFGYTQVSCGCTMADRVSSIRTPDLASGNQQWTLSYAPEGRLASVTDPDGFIEAYGYEPTGELSSLIDRDGKQTAMTHDHLGRILTLVDGLGRMHARSYAVAQLNAPANGTPSAWTGPTLTSGSASATSASLNIGAALNAGDYQIGHNLYQTHDYPPTLAFYRDATFELAYVESSDAVRRPTARSGRTGLPVSSTETLNFTPNFLVEHNGYNTNTNAPIVATVNTPAPSGNWSANFDQNAEFDLTHTIGFGGICNGGNRTEEFYSLDTGGRLTGVHRNFDYGSNCGGPAVTAPDQTYAYYPNGRLQRYTGPDGTKVYTYDARGLLQSLAVTLGSQNETWQFDYDTSGRSFHVTYPDGHVREQLYDSEGRLKSRCYKYSSQSFCYTATYDGAGNPLTMSDPYGGSDAFQYDALNRLSQVTRAVNGTTEHVETYTYNAIGALKTTFDPVGMAEVTLDDQRPKLSGSGTADAAVVKTLGGQPVTLDGGGRITGLAGVTFSHNFRNRVSGMQYASGSNTISEAYNYDSFMRRVERTHTETSPATSTQQFYTFDGANMVATIGPDASTKDAYLFDGTDHPLRLGRTAGTVVDTFYEVDLAGNVRRLRNGSGTDLGGYRYTAFGAAFAADAQTPAPTIDQPLRWKGRWFEPVAGGLYDMRARWWSPAIGAFLSVDDYAYHYANSTLWGWPAQSPIAFTDPSGRFGLGVEVGGAVEAGTPLFGTGAQGGAGVGIFGGGPEGLNVGGFAGGGTLAASLGGSGSDQGAVFGASAGAGLSGFLTNANSAADLGGAFTTASINVGIGPFQFSAQLAWGGGIWFLSFSPPVTGATFGISGSLYQTNTVTTPRPCPR